MKNQSKKRQFIGKEFGKLTIINFVDKPKNTKVGYKYWVLCKCNCGKDFITNLYALMSKNTKSCGCARTPSGRFSAFFKGCGELDGKLFGHIKRTANGGTNKRKRICREFTVTIEYLWELFLKQNRKCALSGIILKLDGFSKNEQTASLDRIDSNKGYIPGNVQWVHKKVNIMKNKFENDEFIEYCKLIANYSNGECQKIPLTFYP